MDRVVVYLDAIEMINRASRRMDRRMDATSASLLESALDAAQAAWLLIPAEWQARLSPPPTREEYLS